MMSTTGLKMMIGSLSLLFITGIPLLRADCGDVYERRDFSFPGAIDLNATAQSIFEQFVPTAEHLRYMSISLQGSAKFQKMTESEEIQQALLDADGAEVAIQADPPSGTFAIQMKAKLGVNEVAVMLLVMSISACDSITPGMQGRFVSIDLSHSSESIRRRFLRMDMMICPERGGSHTVRVDLIEGPMIHDSEKYSNRFSRSIETQKTQLLASGLFAQIPGLGQALSKSTHDAIEPSMEPAASEAKSRRAL